MTNDTERLAREWAEYIKSEKSILRTQEVYAAADYILANASLPTMADVKWDDEKHLMAGAARDYGTGPVDVVMLAGIEERIDFIMLDGTCSYGPSDQFTPNGKRYELREIKEPKHPETLTTEQDYENAPAGTIVAENGESPYVKRWLDDWADRFGEKRSNEGMSSTSRKVLRWGWGA